jgi:predicted MPP superfamily phosphohydrolase
MNRRRFLRGALGCALGVPLAGAAYGRAEASWVGVTRHTVPVPRLPAPFAGLKVALLTDPHHGPFNSLALIREAVAQVNALSPDLIALSGDFIQGPRRSYIRPCFRALAELRAPLGVFAVPGNHDHNYGNYREVRRAMRDHGLLDVTNAGRWVEAAGSRLRVCGVDDLWHGRQDLKAALGDLGPDDAVLLLSHNPDYAERLTDRRVGLVLSGHMHGGQIVIPGVGYHRIPSRYGLKYLEGLVQAPCTQVFVSRGVGTVGLPFRFGCPPEVNLLTLAAAPAERPGRG